MRGIRLNRRIGLLVVSVTAVLALATAVVWSSTPAEPPIEDHAVQQANSLSRAFRAAAKKVLPTVVRVQTSTEPRRIEGRRQRGDNPFKGTPFEHFFDHDEDGFPGFAPRPNAPLRGGFGSGVIIDPSGIVLTNNHVVRGADKVTVVLADGRQFEATDIKTDEKTDLAVLRIHAGKPLPAARLGDSDLLDIGDWVIAVGSPFRLANTVSAGIISAKGRTLSGGQRTKYLQTDAAINPGNSGGPLVNLNGEVVGINTAIASVNGGYQGIGFAIPSNRAKWVTEQLIKSGAVHRAYLGVSIMKVDEDLAEQLGVRFGQGVLVSEVFKNTPAAAAGIQEGDLILTFSGRSVNSPIQLQEVVERCPLGSKQKAEILRNGKPKTLRVVVTSLPKDFGVASRGPSGMGRDGKSPSHANKELGLEVTELTDDVAERLGYKKGTAGVVISRVDPQSIAAMAGLREGTLVLRVGRKQIKNVADFEAAMKTVSLEKGVLMLLRVGDGNRFVVLKKS